MIVADASVIATALLDDEADGDIARRRLRGSQPVAPELMDLPIERARHTALVQRCWALRHNFSPYDAAYVALAEALDTTLVTGDSHLANAPGSHCTIEVLSVSAEQNP